MRILSCLLALLLVFSPLSAQHQFAPKVDPSAPPILLQDAADDTIVNVIVEFADAPLFLTQQNLRKSPPPDVYQARFAQFALDAAQSGAPHVSALRQREFFRIFFGLRTSLPRKAMGTLSRLPYIKRIQIERRVEALLERSLEQIRVPEARNTYGVDGSGILVGIIDTGIDYLHPGLGGGIGPGFKVLGGYDFVNDDPDPMDDNGHGTHVAGIIAANGNPLEGVAPGARLLALKSLDGSGSGLEGDIIAAIEMLVDPNQDGDPSDRPDIVNMSLGARFGSPDDALSTAVDNAVRLGITFCVAAGNSGGYTPVQGKEDNYYYTGMESVESPGTARLAITVGAVDSIDALPRFSSKGPTHGTMEIKPDVLAPGVDILSLAPGGGTALKTGTSMSTPMVAGVAALLKSMRKSMTPEEVKSAMVNSALDLGLSAMRQGGGRVDAMRALGQRTFAVPSQLGFRLDDPAQTTWAKVETLVVVNNGEQLQNYAVSVTGSGPGYSVTPLPQAFSLGPGSAQAVLVSISVNNITVPIVDQDIPLFDGALLVRGTLDTLRIPWAFARASHLLISFSNPNPIFVGYTLGYSITPRIGVFDSKIHWLDAQNLEVIGAFNGTYNFAVYFPDVGKVVTREQFNFQQSGTLTLNSAEAIHTIRFDGRDETGQPFPLTGDTQRTLRVELPLEVPLFVRLPPGTNSIMLSPSSTAVNFEPVESFLDLSGAKRAVVPQYDSFRGIAGDRVLSPASGTYTKQTLHFRMPPGTQRAKLYSEIISFQTIGGNDYFNTIQVGVDTVDVASGVASIQLAVMKPVDSLFTAAIAFYVNAGDPSKDFVDYSTRYFTTVGESLRIGLPSQPLLTSYKSPNLGELTFGGSPVHVVDVSFNNILGTSIAFRPIFRGNLFEERYTDLDHGTYAVYNDAGDKLAEAPLSAPRAPLPVAAGRYRVEIASENFYVSNAKGKVTLTNSVDVSKTVPDAPTITSFMVCDGGGRATDRLVAHDSASLRFSANAFSVQPQLPVADSTRAFYRTYRSTEWIPLPVTLIGSDSAGAGAGSFFRADLTAATANDSAGIDLRIRFVDTWENAADMIVSPAFQVGSWVDGGSSDVPEEGGLPAAYALGQNYPNPFNPTTVVSFQLPAASDVKLMVYDLMGREVATLVEGRREAGTHRITFDGSRLATGAYFYRLQAHSLRPTGRGSVSFTQTRRLLLLK